MQGRIFEQIIDSAIFFCISKVRAPKMADSKLLESKHVSDGHLTNDCSKEIGPLICACCDKSATI